MPELETRTVEYGEIKITVREATQLDGSRRMRLKADAFQEEDLDRRMSALIYADLVAVAVEVEGLSWPLPFEEFITLPDWLVVLWDQAVAELNPHWAGKVDEEEQKKSQTSSTSGS